MENRIKELDGLRGVAIVLVMALHLFNRSTEFTVHPVLEGFTLVTGIGGVGVDIFFTLSGYLITSILFNSKNDKHYFRNFYIRRTLRILPLYFFLIAVVILFAPKIERKFTENLNIALPIMLLYLQNWAQFFGIIYVSHYLSITWSLAIEEQFYFFWPYIVYKLNIKNLFNFICGYISVSIILRLIAVILWTNQTQAEYFFYYGSLARFEEFLFGGMLAILLTHQKHSEKVKTYSPAIFFISLTLFVLFYILSLTEVKPLVDINVPTTIMRYTLSALFTVGLIGIFLTQPPQNLIRRIFANPFLTFMGKYSYSMYLFHVPVAIILLDSFWRTELRGWKAFVLYPATSFLITIGIALLTWHLIEKHMLKLKKYFDHKTS